jgi:hypothetical protein
VFNAKIVVGRRVTGIHWVADTRRVQVSIPTNVYGYGYGLSFVSRVWIRELYIRVLPTRLPSLAKQLLLLAHLVSSPKKCDE